MQIDADLGINSAMTFRLRDVFLPDLDDLATRTTSDLRVMGRVIDFSDSGSTRSRYAILEVEGIEGTVIVPVERLQNSPPDLAGESV